MYNQPGRSFGATPEACDSKGGLPRRVTFSICECCVDLRVAPSARAANSLLLLPPFPPDAERCALTCVESIICVSAAFNRIFRVTYVIVLSGPDLPGFWPPPRKKIEAGAIRASPGLKRYQEH